MSGTALKSSPPERCGRCGSELPAALGICARCLLGEEDASLTRIGDLEIGDELGRGGMGQVFRARDVRLGREVAVKFLAPEMTREPGLRARLEREAQALAQLNHPNIVTLHALGEGEGQTWLVMELVEGTPLPERLPLPPDEAVRITLQVCDALAYAHARGLVHRDIKPANVLVDRDGRVKVGDFGIARWLEPSRPGAILTGAQVVMGTPPYLAPEALAGALPDPRMDVFGVGVLLYELIAGRPPLGAPEPLPGALDAVVRRAMAQDPVKRFASMEALRTALLDASRQTSTLPGDELVWVRVVALVQAVAAALVFFAGVASFTPRVLQDERELVPLVSLNHERLEDGRLVSRARFEIWPTLGAALGIGGALAAYGLLRRHWRRSALDVPQPDAPVPGARVVWWAGAGACALYVVRLLLERSGLVEGTLYIPVLGGVFELWVLYRVCAVLLEASRRQRPFTREPLMWAGALLAIVPPAVEFLRYLDGWRP